MSKGPSLLGLALPLTLANAITKLKGKGKPRYIKEAGRIKAMKAAQVVCNYCKHGQSCKHCRNFNKIVARLTALRNRKAQRRADRAARQAVRA